MSWFYTGFGFAVAGAAVWIGTGWIVGRRSRLAPVGHGCIALCAAFVVAGLWRVGWR